MIYACSLLSCSTYNVILALRLAPLRPQRRLYPTKHSLRYAVTTTAVPVNSLFCFGMSNWLVLNNEWFGARLVSSAFGIAAWHVAQSSIRPYILNVEISALITLADWILIDIDLLLLRPHPRS